MAQKPPEIVSIVSVGARTSVGLTAPAMAAAVRAGLNRFLEHPYMIDKVGERMVVARDAELSEDLMGTERFLQLALPAAEETLASLSVIKSLPRLTVLLGLPVGRFGLPTHLVKEVKERFAKRLTGRWHLVDFQVIQGGHAAGLLAIEQGVQLIRSGQTALCLVGGIDSYLQPETLEWLDYQGHLHSSENPYGFIPGEAAGFVLLASHSMSRQFTKGALAQVLEVASAREKNCIYTDTVCTGEGLTTAFLQVFQSLVATGEKVSQVFCDMNGERYRADEYGFSVVRTREYFSNPSNFVTPASCWGDIGAATGTLLVILAVMAAAKGYAPGAYPLLWSSSVGGERGAAILYAPPQSRE